MLWMCFREQASLLYSFIFSRANQTPCKLPGACHHLRCAGSCRRMQSFTCPGNSLHQAKEQRAGCVLQALGEVMFARGGAKCFCFECVLLWSNAGDDARKKGIKFVLFISFSAEAQCNLILFFSMQVKTPKMGETAEIKKNLRRKATKMSWSLGSRCPCPLSRAFTSHYLRTRAMWPPRSRRRVKRTELKSPAAPTSQTCVCVCMSAWAEAG